MKKIRVIHLPTTVGGNPQGISKHLQELGVKSETWTLRQNYFAYPADKVICNDNDGIVICEIKRLFALRYILLADLIFLNFGRGLFSPILDVRDHNNRLGWRKYFLQLYKYYSGLISKIEIGLIKILKKPIFIQYQGSDARQYDYCRQNFAITYANSPVQKYHNTNSDELKRQSIAFFKKKASKIYALNPDLLHVLPKNTEFLPYSHVNMDEWQPYYTQLENRPLRICHAPTNRNIKGTDYVLKAVKELEKIGYEIDLVLVENKSNIEAKKLYKTSDILLDQLLAGWYGGLAVEAMALGKPVIAYIRMDDLKFIPELMRNDLPIIHAEPDNIFEVLKNVLEMPRKELLAKAYESRAFVEKWHNPVSIAKRIKMDMETELKKECRKNN